MYDGHSSDSLVDRTRGVSRINSDPLVLMAPKRSVDIPLIRYRYIHDNEHEFRKRAISPPKEAPVVTVSSQPTKVIGSIKKRKTRTPRLPPVQEQVITWERTTPTKKKHSATKRRKPNGKSSSISSFFCTTRILESMRTAKLHPTSATLYQSVLLELLHLNHQVISGVQELVKSAYVIISLFDIIPTTTDNDDTTGKDLVLDVCGCDISPSCRQLEHYLPKHKQSPFVLPSFFAIPQRHDEDASEYRQEHTPDITLTV
jgi:hypothetical protein